MLLYFPLFTPPTTSSVVRQSGPKTLRSPTAPPPPRCHKVEALLFPGHTAAEAPFNTGTTSGFEDCQAGARPKIRPVARVITSVKINARESIAKKLLTML